MRDRAFFSVKETQHLFVGVRGRQRKKLRYHRRLSSTFAFLPKCQEGRHARSHDYGVMVAGEREAPLPESPARQVPR